MAERLRRSTWWGRASTLRRGSGLPRGARSGLGAPEAFVARHVLGLRVVVLAYVVWNEAGLYGWDLTRWDWLWTAGTVLFVVAYPLTFSLSDRVEVTVRRLVTSRTLEAAAEEPVDVDAVLAALHDRARRAGRWWSPVFAVAMVVGWVAAKRSDVLAWSPTIAGQVLGAVLVGGFAGRAYVYGTVGRFLQRRGLRISPVPGHLDGAAGLRPVGDLFLVSASLMAVLALYFACWSLLFRVLDSYQDWVPVYLGFFAVSLVAEALVFVLPLVSFHVLMRAAKADLLVEADRHAHTVHELRRAWLTAADDAERAGLTTRIEFLVARYEEIVRMPTWPLDAGIRRRLAVNNAFAVLPVVFQLVAGFSDTWQILSPSAS